MWGETRLLLSFARTPIIQACWPKHTATSCWLGLRGCGHVRHIWQTDTGWHVCDRPHVSSKQSYITPHPPQTKEAQSLRRQPTYTSINETKRSIDSDVIKNESAMNMPYKKKKKSNVHRINHLSVKWYIISSIRVDYCQSCFSNIILKTNVAVFIAVTFTLSARERNVLMIVDFSRSKLI